jgi:hypothetical protein
MTVENGTYLSVRPGASAEKIESPVALSFTRFVAAHGGSKSLRAEDKPPEFLACNPLTFTRRLWLVSRTPSHGGDSSGNGEAV